MKNLTWALLLLILVGQGYINYRITKNERYILGLVYIATNRLTVDDIIKATHEKKKTLWQVPFVENTKDNKGFTARELKEQVWQK